MSEDDALELLRLWLEAQAEGPLGESLGGLGAGPGAAWRQAERIFEAWNGLTGAMDSAAGGMAAFDPAAWLQPGGEAGLETLRGWLGGGDAPSAREWAAYAEALEKQRAIVGASWLAAFRAFAEEARRAFDDARRHDRPAPGWRELEALWRGIADREFAATQTSRPFLDAQAALLRAGLDLRLRLRGQVEAMAAVLGLPTRAEVDDMAEAIHRLRREVRALRGGDGR